jgi:hypothetical protein
VNLPQVLIKQRLGKITQIQRDDGLIELDDKYIVTDYHKLFPVLLDAIYQVRNSLIHGSMELNEKNHNVVKYCYLILWELLMKKFSNRNAIRNSAYRTGNMLVHQLYRLWVKISQDNQL